MNGVVTKITTALVYGVAFVISLAFLGGLYAGSMWLWVKLLHTLWRMT